MGTILLKNGLVVTPQTVVRTDIVLRDGKIELGADKASCEKVVDITGKYVVPGFVDIHFHGYSLFDFTVGRYDPETETFDNSSTAYEQGFDMLRRKLARFGVTGFFVATFAASIKTLRHCYTRLAEYLSNKAGDDTAGARLLGGMLEGTFVNPDMAGALNPRYIFEPSREVFDSIEDGDMIRMANVVPDFGPASRNLTEYLTKKGIVVGFGHSNATCNQVANAIKAGLKYTMHFMNGPVGTSYKPFGGGGAVEAVLKFDELYAEQICDGFHVNPAYVRDAIERKGADRIVGITDCMFVAGTDLTEFKSGGIRGAVSENGSYLRVVDKVDALFGSKLTMNTGFANMLSWLTIDMQGIWKRIHKALGLDEALVACASIFSSNPCRLTGLDKEGFGSIVAGAKADLCVLDVAGSPGDYKVTVESTIVDGNTVYSAE